MKNLKQKLKGSWLAAAALAAVCLASAPAFATSTATANFSVTATVNATCTIAATNLVFGTYVGTVASATSTVTVTCTNTTPYNVGLNAGISSGATVTTRAMTGPSSALLYYALYQDTGYTTNWGNTPGTDTVAGTGNGAAQILTVYGKINAGQYPAPGSYSDTVTATVTY